jgi:hypothetical protein
MGFWTFLQRTKRIQGIFKKKTADSVVEGGGGIKEGEGFFCKTFISFPPPPHSKQGRGLGVAGLAGGGDCQRSRAWQGSESGGKWVGGRGGSILTLGWGGARRWLHRRRRTVGGGG